MKKIWIDTDIGGDIDDALALLLAISLKDEIEILGVSTVFENTIARAKIAKTIFNLANMDIKVYAGNKKPYKIKKVFHDKVDTEKYPITYINDLFDKAKKYTAYKTENGDIELRDSNGLVITNYNLDLCGYPHIEEEILDQMDLIQRYQEERTSLNAEIDRVLADITAILGGGQE